MVKLEEVCEIQRGGSPRPIEKFITEAENGINWIKIGDVAEGAKYITSTKEKIRNEGAARSRAVREGDFLLSNSMSFGRPYILRTSGCIHDGWLVLRYDKNRLTEDYLYHVLGSGFVYAQFENLAVGAVVKNLNSEVVRNVSIPLPPLSEQRRIAAILDQADALRAKRREALAQLDELQQAIFIEMFGDPITGRSKWPVGLLGTVCEKISDGTHHSPPIQKKGVPYITAKHLKTYGLDFFSDPWFISEKDHMQIFARCDPRPDDVLYIKDGATTGIAAVNRYDFPFSMLSSLALLRPNKKLLNSWYLCLWLNHPKVKMEILGAMAGAAIRRLTLAKIKAVEIPIPPMVLQREFSSQIGHIRTLKEKSAASLSELDQLFSSLQHRVFRGEL